MIKLTDIKELIDDAYGVAIGSVVYHMATGQPGIVLAYETYTDSSGTMLQVKVAWAPECTTTCHLEELSTDKVFI